MGNRPVTIVLVGLGGMGAVYVEELLKTPAADSFMILGGVDPDPERCPRLAELRSRGVSVFREVDEFYAERTAELAVISSPPQHHARQTIAALAGGSHVLCEKPAAPTIQETRAMAAAERQAGRWAAIGYQWSFSAAVQALKADILEGRFGRPLRCKCLYTWPRDGAYYRRNAWAGRLRAADGSWILDGPANNAMAHDLHNIFYLLGPDVRRCALPVRVKAELYRANPIENNDTAAARFLTDGGAEVLFLVSHASRDDRGPVLDFEFERGRVTANGRGSGLRAAFDDGSTRAYGDPDAEPMKKLWDSIRAVRTAIPPVCGIEAASGQTLAVNGMQDSSPGIVELPSSLRRSASAAGSERIWVEGLDEALALSFEADLLPAEAGLPWAEPGREIDLREYREYPGPRIGRAGRLVG